MADLSHILDAIDEPALLVREHRLLTANRAAQAVFTRRLGQNDIRLVIRHPAVLEAIEQRSEATLDVEGIGGVDRPWRVRTMPLEDGTFLLRMLDRGAERAAERMRVDFVANASHELRTPLTTIRGYAETLADDGEMDEAMRRKFSAIIESESIRMLRIVEDLMDLSRIEADRFIRPNERASLQHLIREAADHSAEYAERCRCTIECDLDPDVPDVPADRGQLQQLLDNLIGNAIRYGCTPDKPAVTVSLSNVGRFARIRIRDQGEGIAPDHLPRLTERFYRADAARSRESGGTGLGLAIVKHIVERHRGLLDISSTPGSGTIVTVDLPRG